MTEHEVSHIEIVEEVLTEEKQNSLTAPTFFNALTDKDGWKKDALRMGYILLAVALAGGVVWGALAIKNMPSWGLRWQAPVQKINYQTYNENPNFIFTYPAKYLLDKDEKHKFGADYLAGFHLAADNRTGCDVRQSEVGINFAKSDAEISAAIADELSKQVKGFDGFAGQRIKLGKTEGYQTDFLLTDPLGNTLHLTQVLTTNGDKNYLLVCGSGAGQYEFFQQDFADFLQSFRFKA